MKKIKIMFLLSSVIAFSLVGCSYLPTGMKTQSPVENEVQGIIPVVSSKNEKSRETIAAVPNDDVSGYDKEAEESVKFVDTNNEKNSKDDSLVSESELSIVVSDTKKPVESVDKDKEEYIADTNSDKPDETTETESKVLTVGETIRNAIWSTGNEPSDEYVNHCETEYTRISDYITLENYCQNIIKRIERSSKVERIAPQFLEMFDDSIVLPEYRLWYCQNDLLCLMDWFSDIDDEKCLQMMSLLLEDESLSLKNGGGGDLVLKPFKQAQVAGVDFDTSERLSLEELKAILDQLLTIQDYDERVNFFFEQLTNKQRYPDYFYSMNTVSAVYCPEKETFQSDDAESICINLSRKKLTDEELASKMAEETPIWYVGYKPGFVSYSERDINGELQRHTYNFSDNRLE